MGINVSILMFHLVGPSKSRTLDQKDIEMNTYLIQTTGTVQITKQGSRFYFQDDYFWIVDTDGNPNFAKKSSEISSIELIN